MVFPVYIWGIPLIVEQFIKKVENLHDKYIFAVLTYGGTAGAAVKLFAKMIENRGGKLALGFKVHMPGNYTPLYGAIDEKKQQRLFSDWQQRLPAIAKAITSRRRGINENDNPLFNFIFSEIIYHSAAPHFSTMDKNFWTDAKCNHCGICHQVCPVGNIQWVNAKPSWQGRCEQCFACLNWCPEAAIQYGKRTAKRKRYHHPQVAIPDLIQQAGIFRGREEK